MSSPFFKGQYLDYDMVARLGEYQFKSYRPSFITPSVERADY